MGPPELIEVGVAERALVGVSGDRAVVAPHASAVLVAAIDGVGHGRDAAAASAVAADRLGRFAGEPLEDLFKDCHRALARTRGAVMTAALLDRAGTLRWAGVGNVEARLVRPAGAAGGRRRESPVLIGGVLGHQMRTVRVSELTLLPGDVLLMATDGVRADFAGGLGVEGSAQAVAERAMARSAKVHDDALVVAVRWLGR